MSKHTPGPWFMTDELPGYKHRINNTPQNLGWDLAHVCNGPEADANARLIAAAPELLYALRFYMAQFGQDLIIKGIPFDASQVQADKIARDAIFKATGENK